MKFCRSWSLAFDVTGSATRLKKDLWYLQVTKLCDFSPNDLVCSVGWTQRGTYLAVGTNLGEVQVQHILPVMKLLNPSHKEDVSYGNKELIHVHLIHAIASRLVRAAKLCLTAHWGKKMFYYLVPKISLPTSCRFGMQLVAKRFGQWEATAPG